MRRPKRGAAAWMVLAWCVACAPKGEVETAVSPAPASPEPALAAVLDPIGTFTFATIYEGAPLEGKIVIRGEPNQYTGTVVPVGGPGPVDIYAVAVDGQTLTVFGDAGGDDLIITMKFDGDAYIGSWALGFDGGQMKGSRVHDEP